MMKRIGVLVVLALLAVGSTVLHGAVKAASAGATKEVPKACGGPTCCGKC